MTSVRLEPSLLSQSLYLCFMSVHFLITLWIGEARYKCRVISICLLHVVSSAYNLCKQFRPKSSPTLYWASSGSWLFDTLKTSLKDLFVKNDLGKKISRRRKSMQNYPACKESISLDDIYTAIITMLYRLCRYNAFFWILKRFPGSMSVTEFIVTHLFSTLIDVHVRMCICCTQRIKTCQLRFETIRVSLMRPRWPKLASLAQKICTL